MAERLHHADRSERHCRARPTRPGPALVLALSALAIHPVPARAQTFSGIVVEAGSGHPVLGAMVTVETRADGAILGSFFTASAGRFVIAPTRPASGPLRIRAERIGYVATVVNLDGLPTGDVRVEMDPAPIALTSLAVTGDRRRCEMSEGTATETHAVWTDVRRALAAATWTASDRALRFRLRSRERRLSPGDLTVLEQDSRTVTGWGENSVRSLAPEDLASGGYVRAVGDGQTDYYAPDAEALLSDAFLRTHCLSVTGHPDDDALVGVRFEPVPGTDRTDIAGVFWLHRQSATLVRIDFTYTPRASHVSAEHAGGAIRFASLPDGRWIVRDWHIRAPVERLVASGSALGSTERRMVASVAEFSSTVMNVTAPDFTWTPSDSTYVVAGLAYDSLAHAPLAHAEVRLAGRGWSTTTDATGRFELTGVPAGGYRVSLHGARIETLGITAPFTDVEVGPGRVRPTVTLAIPSETTLLASRCASPGRAVVARVRMDDGTPAPVLTVVSAVDPGVAEAERRAQATEVPGLYLLCESLEDRTVRVAARLGPFESSPVDVPPGPASIVDIDLVLPREATSAASVIAGVVVSAEDGQPIEAAEIGWRSRDGSRSGVVLTDRLGTFRFSGVTAGAYDLTARRLGFRDTEGAIAVAPGASARVEVRMPSRAMAIEGVVVEVEARVRQLERAGFYERFLRERGEFLDQADIEAIQPTRMTDVLFRVQGITPAAVFAESSNTTVRRFQIRGAVRASQDQRCFPLIYINGSIAREGKHLVNAEEAPFYTPIDQLVNPWDVEALEVYDGPSSTPAAFRGPGFECGVVVVWLRY